MDHMGRARESSSFIVHGKELDNETPDYMFKK